MNLKGRRITVWIGENGARPQIARRSRSVKRVLYALFFDARGIVARIPVPEHKTLTGIYYAEQVLPVVVNHYMATRPRNRGAEPEASPRQRPSPLLSRGTGLFENTRI